MRILKLMRIFPVGTMLLAAGCARYRGAGEPEVAGGGGSFHERFDRFEITPSDLKRFDRKEVTRLEPTMILAAAAGMASHLELVLGERSGWAGTPSPRTSSRYRLMVGGTAKVAAEAESLLSLADMPGDGNTKITVLKESETGPIFIAEQRSPEAGRCVLMDESRVSYFAMPAAASSGGMAPAEPKFLGFQAGRVYLKMEGHFYAIPVEAMAATAKPGHSGR